MRQENEHRIYNALDTLKTEGYDTDKITMCECEDSSSSEWPAVISVLQLEQNRLNTRT